MGGGKQKSLIRETTVIPLQLEPCFSCTSRDSSLLDWIDLHSEHSGIWSGASGNGGHSGGCLQRHLCGHCGRCCQRTGGLYSSRRRRPHRNHRSQLSSRPNSTSSFVSASSTSAYVIAIRARQKHGMLGQSQQRFGIGPRSRAHCRPTGMAPTQNTLTATAPRRPPRHRRNPTSGKSCFSKNTYLLIYVMRQLLT